MRRLILLMLVCLPLNAQAKPKPDMLGMVTGDAAGTYHMIGTDIAKIVQPELAIDVMPSNGSIDNLQRISKAGENASLGIVQSDVIAFLLQSEKPESKEIARRLRMVMPLYKEEIHVLARRDITSLADLNGKRVVIGNAGSGSMMTSVNLFATTGVKPGNMFQIDAPEAVVAVMANRADAMVFVGGTPVPMFKNLEGLTGKKGEEFDALLQQVHFLPLNDTRLLDQYEPATITHADYNFVTDDVPTMAVRSVLVTFDFTSKDTAYYKARCKQLGTLGRLLREKLPELQKSGHAKWKQVNLDAELKMWRRDKCVWPEAKTPEIPQATPSALEQELLSVITGTPATPAAP